MPSLRRLVTRDGAQDCDTQAGCLATGMPKAAQAALPNPFQPNVTAMLTSRERLITTLEHRQPDRVCVDVGGSGTSGIHASTGSMNMLGFRNDGWKPWELSDGTPVLVP